MKHLSPRSYRGRFFVLANCALLFVMTCVFGCKKSDPAMAALETDANGFACSDCKAKFFTERKVFPTQCPDCKKKNINQAVGYVCDADKQMTIKARNVLAVKCKQCSAPVNQIYMPQTVDLKAWGATLKTEAEVTGQ
jgi:hypothetical protein